MQQEEDTPMRVAAPSENRTSSTLSYARHGAKANSRTELLFGSVDWALAKVLRGFERGCSPGVTDCHGRAGHALRLLEHLEDRNPDADTSFMLLGLPSGKVAHSLVTYRGIPLASTRDRNVLKKFRQYKILHKESGESARAWLSANPSGFLADPFDPVVAQVMEVTGDPELAVLYLERTIDEIIKGKAMGSRVGLDSKDLVENALLQGLVTSGAARPLLQEGTVSRLELTNTGRKMLTARWDREVSLQRMTRERQLALLEEAGWDTGGEVPGPMTPSGSSS